MKIHSKSNIWLCGIYIALTFALVSNEANAVGTAADTDVGNYATLNFNVGGVAQPDIVSSDTGNSDPSLTPCALGGPYVSCARRSEFLVDRLLDILVTDQDTAYIDVTPGASEVYLTFDVSNQGNDTQDILLTAVHTTDPFGGTDTFDINDATFEIWADNASVGAIGTFDSLNDTNLTSGDEGTIDDITADDSQRIFLVADVYNNSDLITIAGLTAGTIDGAISAVSLVAQVADSSTGTEITASDGADDPTTVENVLADNAAYAYGGGSDGGDTIATEDQYWDFTGGGTAHTGEGTDVAINGQASDTSAFRLASVEVTVTKTVTTICDDINLGSDGANVPKALPGSIQRYQITIANSSPVTSTSAVLTYLDDLIPADTQLVTVMRDYTGLAEGTDTCSDGTALSGTAGFRTWCTGGRSGVGCGTVGSPTYYDQGNGTTDAVDSSGTTAGDTITFCLDTSTNSTGVSCTSVTTPVLDDNPFPYAEGELPDGDTLVLEFDAQVL